MIGGVDPSRRAALGLMAALPFAGRAAAQAPVDGRLVGAWTRVVADGLPAPGSHRFCFDRGDETLDQFYATFQSRIDAVFRERGYDPRDFQSLVFPGHQHNEASWNGRLDVPLKFLLTSA